MKRYPYSDSTDVVIYNGNDNKKKKREKKQRPWVIAVSSALAASVFTMGITFGVQALSGGKAPQLDTSTAGASSSNVVASAAVTASYTDETGKTVLSIPEIAAKVGPSVVGVINKTTVKTPQYWDPWSGRYYYNQDTQQEGETVEQGSGSGIIISEDGYIATNQHVIEGATEVEVILNTGTT